MSMIQENDVCVVYLNELPSTFIRIESIVPDVKKGWFIVCFVELKFPLEIYTWTVDESHLSGETIYMKGVPYRLQKLITEESKKVKISKERKTEDIKLAKVISLADWKEKRIIKEIPKIIA